MTISGRLPGISAVAKRANVSPRTVSLVLNSKGSISADTRARVLRVCTELQYRPHPTARFLPKLRGRGESRVLTDLFSFTTILRKDRPSTYSDFLEGVARGAVARHKMVVYQPLELDELPASPLLQQVGLDGRIVIGHVDDRVLDAFAAEELPIVVIGDHECERPVWNV